MNLADCWKFPFLLMKTEELFEWLSTSYNRSSIPKRKIKSAWDLEMILGLFIMDGNISRLSVLPEMMSVSD